MLKSFKVCALLTYAPKYPYLVLPLFINDRVKEFNLYFVFQVLGMDARCIRYLSHLENNGSHIWWTEETKIYFNIFSALLIWQNVTNFCCFEDYFTSEILWFSAHTQKVPVLFVSGHQWSLQRYGNPVGAYQSLACFVVVVSFKNSFAKTDLQSGT